MKEERAFKRPLLFLDMCGLTTDGSISHLQDICRALVEEQLDALVAVKDYLIQD